MKHRKLRDLRTARQLGGACALLVWVSIFPQTLIADELLNLRLFTSHQERQALDIARLKSVQPAQSVVKPKAAVVPERARAKTAQKAKPVAKAVRLQGIVQRQGAAPSTVWMNGKVEVLWQAQSKKSHGYRLSEDGQSVTLIRAGKRLSVRPGQSVKRGQVSNAGDMVVQRSHASR